MMVLSWSISQFQSTLPMRGATSYLHHEDDCNHISIHAPHEGSDSALLPVSREQVEFQSTLPMRGATRSLPAPSPRSVDFNPRSP